MESFRCINLVSPIKWHQFYSVFFHIGTDGSFSDTSRYSNFVGTAKGTWTFSDDKLKVNFNATSTNLIFTVNGINAWNIIKLAKDEIKFEHLSGIVERDIYNLKIQNLSVGGEKIGGGVSQTLSGKMLISALKIQNNSLKFGGVKEKMYIYQNN